MKLLTNFRSAMGTRLQTRSEKMRKTQREQKDRDSEVVLDLTSFVTEVEHFSSLIEPFAFFFYAIDDIRRSVYFLLI